MPVCLPVCSWRVAARSRPLLLKTFAAALGAAAMLLGAAHGEPAAVSGGAPARGGPAVADDSIVVRGNRRIDAAAIREHFRGSPAARVEPKAVNTALKELYATGLFDDVKIARSGATLIVTVVEAPMIEHLRFTGNSKIKDKDLENAIASKSRGSYTKAAVANDVARLVEAYRAIGRFEVEVRPKTVPRGEGRVDLLFQIKEGDKTGVKRILFAGNRSIGEDRLRSVIKTTESGWFAFLKTSDVYDPDRIEADSDLLRRFYLKNGFPDVHVTAEGAYDANAKGFTVTFSIDEGERYRVGAIEVTARVDGLDGAALRSSIGLTPGAAFDGEAIDKAADSLTIALGQRGYPFAAVRPHLVRNAAAQSVDILFTIDSGAHQYIERITIRGNTVTRDDVIRREFDLAEGDAFNRALIERAEKRLRALGILKSAKIAVAPGSAPDRVVLNVEVEEERTGDLGLSGGYSTSAGFIGEISVAEHNLLGTGAYAKVAATLGQYQRGAELSFAEPYFLGNRMTAGLDLFYRDTLTSSTQSYGSTYYGAALKLDAPLMDNVTAQARYSLVNQSLSLNPALMDCSSAIPPPVCMYNGEASAAVKQAALNGPQWVSTIGTTVAYSSVDNPKAPHEGLRAELRQDVAGLGGDADFLKTTGDVRYYHDLGGDVVAMARGQGGYVLPYGNQPLPFVSGFFGGPQFVRGFAPNGFGPRDLTTYTTQDNIGGSQFWATTAELQSPIPWLPPEIALKAAVFADAGSLWGYRGQTYFPALSPSLMAIGDSRQIRSSIGSSLIWDSPFGPLRVDYAYPISKASYDVTQRVHFGFGAF